MDSNVGLAIQCVGIGLVTLLSFFMMRSIQGASQRYWTVAWSCLSLALSSLIVAFHAAALKNFFYPLYFFGEYAFGLMFVAGCRHHAAGARLSRRAALAFAPFAALAVALPFASDDFNDLFLMHAPVMSGLFAAGYFAMRRARPGGHVSPGQRVMSVALLLLALDFLHYVPVFGDRDGAWGFSVPAGYLQYTSIVDLLLETLLGFGTVMVLMEGVRREVEEANRELTAARDKLEMMARVDPLTDALNRHAFHSLLSRDSARRDASGCVAVIDLDDLKQINDTHGHAAGDRAIRAVAHAVRSVVRADDLLFRWGGDEFLVLMFGMPESKARARLDSLNARLARVELADARPPVAVGVSHGLARFDDLRELHDAIELADASMYRRKQSGKAARLDTVSV
jgi:diguanylate cyclase (GGDEF)-like protein